MLVACALVLAVVAGLVAWGRAAADRGLVWAVPYAGHASTIVGAGARQALLATGPALTQVSLADGSRREVGEAGPQVEAHAVPGGLLVADVTTPGSAVRLRLLDDDGRWAWTRTFPAGSRTAGVDPDAGRVFVVLDGPRTVALDTRTGAELWSRPVAMRAGYRWTDAPTALEPARDLLSGEGAVSLVSGADGTELATDLPATSISTGRHVVDVTACRFVVRREGGPPLEGEIRTARHDCRIASGSDDAVWVTAGDEEIYVVDLARGVGRPVGVPDQGWLGTLRPGMWWAAPAGNRTAVWAVGERVWTRGTALRRWAAHPLGAVVVTEANPFVALASGQPFDAQRYDVVDARHPTSVVRDGDWIDSLVTPAGALVLLGDELVLVS